MDLLRAANAVILSKRSAVEGSRCVLLLLTALVLLRTPCGGDALRHAQGRLSTALSMTEGG